MYDIKDKLEKLKQVYLKKEYDDPNTIYILIKIVNNYAIFRTLDTITLKEEIIALPEIFLKTEFYTAYEYIKNAEFIGKTGFYKNMSDLEKYIYLNYILYYKDDFYELIYDTFDKKIKIMPSIYAIEDFIEKETPQTNDIVITRIKI